MTDKNTTPDNVKRYTDPAMIHIAKNRAWSAVAEACGIKRQAPFQWRRVPAERVIAVAKATGLARHFIRPDIYPKK